MARWTLGQESIESRPLRFDIDEPSTAIRISMQQRGDVDEVQVGDGNPARNWSAQHDVAATALDVGDRLALADMRPGPTKTCCG